MPSEQNVTPGQAPIGFRRNLMRPEDSERTDRVTYIELFFDLIFVFALTQLSNHLYENQSVLGAAESAVLVLALWWVWVYTTWVTNWLDPARLLVRGVVIGLALVGLVMSTSIYEAFGDRGLAFALAYVALQLGRTVFMVLAAARHDAELYRELAQVLVWLSIASVFWIAGALLPLAYRLPVWAAALVVEYLSANRGFRIPGMTSGRLGDGRLSGAHIAERSALFVIIALGESFLVTGFAFVDQEASVAGVIGVITAFVTAVAMWWLYFDHGERAGSRAIENADMPGKLARVAYTYVHTLIIAGIVLASVADKEILAHPDAGMKLSTAITIIGGPVLYLVGLLLFRWVVARELLRFHIVGVAVMLALFAVAFTLTPLVLGVVVTLALVGVASAETIVRVRRGTDDAEAG
ncbi:low temperature requirement protein A [Marisediminicola antarctica]|nr:low temperature requirement protein A [Marisediminicola antarctica]